MSEPVWDNAPCPNTKEGVDFLVDHLQAELAAELLSLGSLEPRALVLFETDNNVHRLGETRLGEFFSRGIEGKEVAAQMVRDLAKKLDAYGVFFISEAWVVVSGPDEKREDLPEDFENLPEDRRRETVTMTIDHEDWGNGIITAEIDRSSGRPVMGEFGDALRDVGGGDDGESHSEGRFVGLRSEKRPVS